MIKATNVNIQITLTQDTANKLNAIAEDLSDKLCLNVSKSQAITFLINNYGKTAKSESKPQPKAKASAINYQAQIRALKDKLGVSFTELSNLLDIPPSTLKKYASGAQQPKEENEEKIMQALKRYGIK